MAVLLGQTTSGVNADFFASGHTGAWKFTAVGSGVLAKIVCQLKVANAGLTVVKLGIYGDAGAGFPDTLLDSATVSPTPTGTGLFEALVAGGVGIVLGTDYWLAVGATGEQVDLQGTADATGLEGVGNLSSPWVGAGGMQSKPTIWGESAAVRAIVQPLLMRLSR